MEGWARVVFPAATITQPACSHELVGHFNPDWIQRGR